MLMEKHMNYHRQSSIPNLLNNLLNSFSLLFLNRLNIIGYKHISLPKPIIVYNLFNLIMKIITKALLLVAISTIAFFFS